MDQRREQLFDELIAASRTLVTTCNLAATVLSEEFEDMITGPMTAVSEILNKCPEGGIAWDGTFDESDVDQQSFNTGIDGMLGIRFVHLPSGKSVEMSYPVSDNEERKSKMSINLMASLRGMVAAYVSRQKEIGSL